MADLTTRWNASHDRMRVAKSALDEARRAKNRSNRVIRHAEEAYQAAISAHYIILDEQRIEMEAEFAAEEAAAVDAAVSILKGN